MRTARRSFLLTVLVLTGCAAGPDFRRPVAPEMAAYTATAVATQTASAGTHAGEAQRFVSVPAIEMPWWQSFNSPKLEALIGEALAASPNLAAAQAALRQARELRDAQAGATLSPQVEAGLGAQRQRISPSALGQSGAAREFSLYNASVGVRYHLDLSGVNRRTLEALAARAEYRQHELEAARLTLAAQLAATAIARARLAAQFETTAAILRNQEEHLAIVGERMRLGQSAPDEALAVQAQVEQTRAGLPVLRKQMQQAGHLLAVLAGREPGAADMPEFTLADFTLPAALPLVVPSELVRRRPDIQAAEALLHAANAEYGAAAARLYPRLSLSAGLGSQALTLGTLFGGGAGVWSLAGQLTQPVFNPGLPAEKRAALAAFDAASANYRSVVLEALRNVADVLRALENDAEALAAQAAAAAAADASTQIVEQRYRLGAASYVQWLVAQQQTQQARLGLAAAQAQRLTDSVALYQAMGSGAAATTAPE